MTTMRARTCLWCGGPLPDGASRGSPRRFCCPDHRRAYHTAARQYVDRLVQEGRIGPADLSASRKARTLVAGVVSPVRVVWATPETIALSGLQNAP